VTVTGADAVVPDASVLATVVFGEPRAEEAVGLLAGKSLVAPGLLRYEIGNIARTKAARAPEDVGRISAAFDYFLDLSIRWVAPDPVLTLNLALERNVTYYDAAYLWLSRRLALPLLTFDEHLLSAPLASHDKALRQAAQATGIQLLS